MSYLSIEKADILLAKNNNCNLDLEASDIIECLDAYIDQWLGYSMLPTQYKTKSSPNHNGLIHLKNSPVISIESIVHILPETYPGDSLLEKYDASALYDGKSTLNLTGYCTCLFSPVFEITYLAGYDPLPKVAEIAATKLFQEILKYEGDIGFLSRPYREIKRVELPSTDGGIKREYNVAPLNGETTLDIILKPLLGKYKQQIFY